MDEIDKLGLSPSEKRKLQLMGIKKIAQVALLGYNDLGFSQNKAKSIIRRARNIIANESIKDIEIGEDEIIIRLKKKSMAAIKSILDVLGVYQYPAAAAMREEGDAIVLLRRNKNFDRIIEGAKVQREMVLEMEDEEEVDEEAAREFAFKNGFDGFWKNVFKFIRGNEVMKKAITVSLFSTFEEPVHTLIIGEPGSAKTLAKEILLENFSDITSIGANTTRAGLVINLATGELGALAYSDEHLVLVDEMDKIPEHDIQYCYELLSNGKSSIHSARIHEEIESRFIMIAFANPSGQIFRKEAIEEIPLPPLLVSRFALIVKTEKISREDRIELFKQKFMGMEERKKGRIYDEWVKVARKFTPKIEAEEREIEAYIKNVDEIVEKYYSTKLRRDLRMGDYMRRIPQAIARASFENITKDILEKSEDIIIASVETWS